MPEDQAAQRRPSVSDLQDLFKKVLLPVPRPWLVALSVAIVISLFDITATPDKVTTIAFRFTSVTAALLGLVWLPFLLKVLALTGGGLSAMGAEASFKGLADVLNLLEPSERREAVSTFVAALDIAEEKSPEPERAAIREQRQAFEAQLETLVPEAQEARALLGKYAQEYESLRTGKDSSVGRTVAFTRIVAQSRALAKQAGYGSLEVSNLFAGKSEGNRIVALAIIQALPRSNYFELVMESITDSRSAFEQYQGLSAAERSLPLLDEAQKERLRSALENPTKKSNVRYITPDSDRYGLKERILRYVRGPAG